MKLEELENYSLLVTEAQLIKNEETEYELKKGVEIPTSCGFLEISDYIKLGNDFSGIKINYYDDNNVLKTAEITLENSPTIRLMEGNDDIYRISDITFKIIENK